MFRPFVLTLLAGACATTLTGCALGQSSGGDVQAGSLGEQAPLKGATITVGGKEFTEQLVLCEISALSFESAGATVKRSCGLSGTNSARAALGSGDIDAYWEYTGTGWITHLQQTENITDPQKLYQAVAAQDLEKNNITWLPAAPANNTYAVAVSKEKATELGVSTVSDYAELASTKPDQASFCGASEFFGRGDGWPGLQKSYGFTVPKSAVAELAAGPIYNSIDKAKPCNFGEVFATDGRVEALGLTVLEDDKKFFAVYNPALNVRKEVVEQYPKLSEVVAPVAAALDDATLRALNAKVDVGGDTPEVVAKQWLQEKGFVK